MKFWHKAIPVFPAKDPAIAPTLIKIFRAAFPEDRELVKVVLTHC
ncbi:hypothetical protein CfE428DRAFT_1001 [Chthoniobacter flavus Ellin428]|uniref:Uncharacterized protein n=1 Tax=Chthoniobacter flavus Ellin428 TaxID=497964 RepID=B4CWG4_9BACT|nr:hypothetical protein [Chthoniobacter flavus]EDY21756.1 hypothetical protein CfE428DRAFT_1001 [Chthoniobacter flavus Ellin428]TCO95688.1 hypothetical protein EV701_101378 [Chthoniobacter flavus]